MQEQRQGQVAAHTGEARASSPDQRRLRDHFSGHASCFQRRISSGTYGAVYQVKGKHGLLFAAKILHNVKGVDPDIQHVTDNLKDISRESGDFLAASVLIFTIHCSCPGCCMRHLPEPEDTSDELIADGIVPDHPSPYIDNAGGQ